MFRLTPFFLVAALITWPLFGADPFPAKKLVDIATRHGVPMPPKEARLVLAHTESWSVLGNRSTSRDPGIYAPAFLLSEEEGKVTILRGMEQKVLRKRRQDEPLWRPFSLEKVEPKLGGHLVRFNALSDFICAVQLASRGDEKNAEAIWKRFSSAEFRDDRGFGEAIPEKLDTPSLLLGRCIYDHLAAELGQSPADWPEIRKRLDKLFVEFPVLRTKERDALFVDLTTTVGAKLPAANSTEALLLDWSRQPGELRHLGIFSRENDKADAPAREIVLRGFDAIPELVKLASDQRITVHVDNQWGTKRIRRVGDLALGLLEEIAGERKDDPKAWEDWWKQARVQKEEDFFATAALRGENGRGVREGPARILGKKYPDRLQAICEEFSKRPDGEPPYGLADAVAASSQPLEKRVRILADFGGRGTLAQKRWVLQVLARLDGKKCAIILAPILKSLPPDSTGPYWTCTEAAYTHVVMQIEDDEIWRAYLRAAKKSSIGLRMEMMNPMNYTYIGDKNRERRLAFLAAFLDDAEVRDQASDEKKFDGPCAGFTIQKLAVRDFVGNMISSILDMDDQLDEFGTADDWSKLREKVRAKLALKKLPDLSSK